MPNIREIEAHDLGLRPSETGVQAQASTARRIGGFYNQAGGAFSDLGQRVGGAIRDAGEAATNYADHQQIMAGGAHGAELFSNLSQSKDDLIKSIDPNDPAYGVKVELALKQWREERLEPDLEQFRSGFTTEKSQQWAEQRVERIRNHMFTESAADISSAAKIGINNSIRTLQNTSSNDAIRDPSSVPTLIDLADHTITGLVGSSALRGTDAARARTEILEKTKEAIVKSGAIGAIAKAGNPEAVADDWIKKYPEYINGAEAKMLASNARTQIRAMRVDAAYADHLNKIEQQDRSDKTETGVLQKLYSDDPQERGSVTTKAVVNDPTLNLTAKRRLINVVERETKPETEARISNRNYVSILSDIRSGKISDVEPIYQARISGDINRADFNQALKDFTDFRSPEGQRVGQAEEQFISAIKPILDKSNPLMGKIDQEGPLNVYRLRMDIKKKVEQYRAAGKDWNDLFDPSKPDFMGTPAALAPYQKTFTQSLQDTARRFGGSNTPPRTTQAPARKAGETPAEYLKRTGQQ